VTTKERYGYFFIVLSPLRYVVERCLPQTLKPYVAFVRSSFLKMLAYRTRYYVGIINYLVFISVNYFIWEAVFAGKGEGALVKGYSFTEMVTYVSVAWLARSFYYSNSDYQMNSMFKTGEITVYLLRPVNFQVMIMAVAIGEVIFRALLLTVPSALVILAIFPVMPPDSFLNLVLFLYSTVISFIILEEIHFITGLAAFYLHSINGVIRAKFFIVQLCSGLLLPIPFFPEWIQFVFKCLPFQIIAFVPLEFYLGRVAPGDIPMVLLNQLFWVGALWGLGAFFSYKAFSKLTIQGG